MLRQKERLERVEEGEDIPTREKSEKWKERESMCGGVREERGKKKKEKRKKKGGTNARETRGEQGGKLEKFGGCGSSDVRTLSLVECIVCLLLNAFTNFDFCPNTFFSKLFITN